MVDSNFIVEAEDFFVLKSLTHTQEKISNPHRVLIPPGDLVHKKTDLHRSFLIIVESEGFFAPTDLAHTRSREKFEPSPGSHPSRRFSA